jgi:hypothetical protein
VACAIATAGTATTSASAIRILPQRNIATSTKLLSAKIGPERRCLLIEINETAPLRCCNGKADSAL